MLDLLIVLATFVYALMVGYGQFDWIATYYVLGAIYALIVGFLVGSMPVNRIQSWRKHAWILGICLCFFFMWFSIDSPYFSGMGVKDKSGIEIVQKLLRPILLLYLGVYIGIRAAPRLKIILSHLPPWLGAGLGRFVGTPPEEFEEATRKMRAILLVVLYSVGVMAAITGDIQKAVDLFGHELRSIIN